MAEKVMGTKVLWAPALYAYKPGEDGGLENMAPEYTKVPVEDMGGGVVLYWTAECGTPTEYAPEPIPRHTSSWDAMREVVEKMLDDLWAFSLSWSPLDGRYHAWFGSADEDYDGEAPTAPEAVALAALTALGHMEDG